MAFTYAGQWGPEALLDINGKPQAATSVGVYLTDGVTLATVYTDRTKGSTTANPLTTDSYGVVTVFAAPGNYILKIAGKNYNVEIAADQGDVIPLSTVTTSQDLIVASGSGAVTRLPIGAAGTYLGVTSGALAYSAPPSANTVMIAGPQPTPLAATAGVAWTSAATYYYKFRSEGAETLTGLNIYCSGGTSPTAGVGLYSDSAGVPNTQLAHSTSSTNALTAGAMTTIAFSAGVTLAVATDYWLAVTVGGTGPAGFGVTLTAALQAVLSGATASLRTVCKTSAVLPSPASSVIQAGSTDVLPQVWAVL